MGNLLEASDRQNTIERREEARNGKYELPSPKAGRERRSEQDRGHKVWKARREKEITRRTGKAKKLLSYSTSRKKAYQQEWQGRVLPSDYGLYDIEGKG